MTDDNGASRSIHFSMPGALRVPVYRRFWSSFVLSLTGAWVRITAMGYLVYEITGDEFRLGLVSFAQAAPVLVVAPVAGILLDRFDRRLILLAAQAIMLLAMLAVTVLVATGEVLFWHLLVVSAVLGIISGFDWPSRTAIIPALVPRDQVQSAIALNAVAFNSSRILGPVLAGWIIGLIGLAWAFGFTTVTLAPFVIVIATLGITSRPDATQPAQTSQTSGISDLVDGYRYIWRHAKIRGLLSVDLIPLALGWSYFTMAPAIARDVLGLGSEGLGLLLTANGIGALAGTLAVATLPEIRHRGRIVIIGVACFALFLLAFALSGNAWLSGFLILGLGLTASFYAIINDTLVQLTVDDAYRGRVTSVYTMLYGLTPIGSLQVGWLAQGIGVQAALAVNGVVILVYATIIWFKTPVRFID